MAHTPTKFLGRSRDLGLAATGTSLEAVQSDDLEDPARLLGVVLDQRYRLEAVLGSGAMAVVFAAQHVFLGKAVAVKVLHPAVMALPEVRQRFQREARATSTIGHPGVVEVTDSGVSEEGYHYLVMEYLEGVDLFRWSEDRRPLTIETLASLGRQLAEALAAIHRAGFVHRDLKPENILVLAQSPEDAPRVKILDLGIAALLVDVESSHASRLTRAHTTVGTVYYMAPEQAAGATVDGRTDIYALGCVLWELATGRLLFEAETQTEVLMRHVSEIPAPPSSINPALPAWFDALVLRCLEKKSAARYQKAEAVAAALAEHLRELDEATVPAAMTGGHELGWFVGTDDALPAVRRRCWFYGVGLFALACVAVGVVFATTQRNAPPGDVAGPALSGIALEPSAPGAEVSAPAVPIESAALLAPEPLETEPSPAVITLTFDIEPAGTTVRRDAIILGTSPLTLEVAPVEGDVAYTFTHPGFEPAVAAVDQTASRRVLLALEPIPSPPVTPPPASSRPRPPPAPAPVKVKPTPAPVKPTPAPVKVEPTPPTDLWRPTRPGGAP